MFVYEENRMANVYIFLLKPFQQWNFEKRQVFFVGQLFPQKHFSFSVEAFQVEAFSLDFCFASFSNLNDLPGCLEKLEILAKRFGL